MLNAGAVYSLAISPDGTRVVAGGWNAALLWDVTISDVEPHSTSRAREILALDRDPSRHGRNAS